MVVGRSRDFSLPGVRSYGYSDRIPEILERGPWKLAERTSEEASRQNVRYLDRNWGVESENSTRMCKNSKNIDFYQKSGGFLWIQRMFRGDRPQRPKRELIRHVCI